MCSGNIPVDKYSSRSLSDNAWYITINVHEPLEWTYASWGSNLVDAYRRGSCPFLLFYTIPPSVGPVPASLISKKAGFSPTFSVLNYRQEAIQDLDIINIGIRQLFKQPDQVLHRLEVIFFR